MPRRMPPTKWFISAALAAGLLVSIPIFADAPPPAAPAAESVDAPAQPEEKQPKVAVISLESQLRERPASFAIPFMGDSADPRAAALSSLNATLNKAVKDPSLGGVLLDFKSFGLTLSQAEEIGEKINELKKAHKRVFVFSSDFDTPNYVLASYADTVIMPENGEILIPGVRLELMFWKGLFDKLNLQADMVQIGKFKGAAEPFTRTDASPEFKAQIDTLVDALYAQVKANIAANRPQLAEAEVEKAIDEGWLTGKRSKELGLVDQLMNRDAVDDYITSQFPKGADLVDDYGQPKKNDIDMNNPFALLSVFAGPKTSNRTNQPAVAVIYADGTIMNDSPDSLDGESDNVTPARIKKAVDAALDDDLVKSIVLRIDSPGGSATASDEIWQMLKTADKTKPVTVSMGHMAASGGYYIACSGRSITADPGTITGSIGVVGGKIVLHGLFDKVGLSTQAFSRGKHADILSEQQPFTDEERTFITKMMTDTYDLFTSRVKAGRGDKIKDIAEVAQGRIFDGQSAQKVGLVDNLGSLDDTVHAAAKAAHIEKNFQVLNFPEPKTLADVLRESFQVDSKTPLELSTAIKALPAAYRGQIQSQIQSMLDMTQTLQSERVLMALPGVVESK